MLDHKNWVRKWSNFQVLQRKTKYMVDSLFNEDSKSVNFFHGGPNFEGGTARKFRENGNNRDIYSYANRGSGEFRKGLLVSTSWYQIFLVPLFSYILDQILKEK